MAKVTVMVAVGALVVKSEGSMAGKGKSHCPDCRQMKPLAEFAGKSCLQCTSKKTGRKIAQAVLKKDASMDNFIMSEEQSNAHAEQQLAIVDHVGSPEKNLNLTFAPNDTVYDRTDRFARPEIASPLDVRYIVERLIRETDANFSQTMEEAVIGAIIGQRFYKMSRYQAGELIRQMRELGHIVDLKKYDGVKTWLGPFNPDNTDAEKSRDGYAYR